MNSSQAYLSLYRFLKLATFTFCNSGAKGHCEESIKWGRSGSKTALSSLNSDKESNIEENEWENTFKGGKQ